MHAWLSRTQTAWLSATQPCILVHDLWNAENKFMFPLHRQSS